MNGQVDVGSSSIEITPAQLDGVIANASALAAEGVTSVTIAVGEDEDAYITPVQADQLVAAGIVVDAVSPDEFDDAEVKVRIDSQLEVSMIDPSGWAAAGITEIANSLPITVSEALIAEMRDAGVVFTNDDFSEDHQVITVVIEDSTPSISLFNFEDVADDGAIVQVAPGTTSLTLALGDGGLERLTGFQADELPQFDVTQTDASLVVTVVINSGTVLPQLDLAQAMANLRAIGVDQITANGPIAMTPAQAAAIATAGLDIPNAVDLTLNVTPAQALGLSTNPTLLVTLDVDHLNLSAPATINVAQAQNLLAAGVDFVDSDTVTLSGPGGNATLTLRSLQQLNIDAVIVTGTAPELTIAAGGSLGEIGLDQLPTFTGTGGANPLVTLTLAEEVAPGFDLSSIAQQLVARGVDRLSMADGDMSLTQAQALQLETAGLDIADSVQVTLNVSETAVHEFAADPSALGFLGVDHIDVAGNAVSLSDAEATALIGAGIDFVDQDVVTISAASGAGTHLSTSLKDLQALNVDTVMVSADGLTIDLGGSLDTLTADSLPTFASAGDAGDVTLNLAGEALDPNLDVAPIAAALAAAGVDHLSATGASLTLTDEQAAAFLAAGIGVLDRTDFAIATSAAELDTVLADTALMAGLGVDHIDLTDNSILLTEAQAASMVAAGVDFVDSDTVAVDASGTQLSTSLKDLQTLNVDTVMVGGGQLSIDAGAPLDSLLADDLPVFQSAGDPDVTINVDAGALDPDVDLGALASAFQAAGIDHIGVAGGGALSLTGAQALTLGDHGISFDTGTDVTVSLATGAELTDLTAMIGDLNVDHIDMAGNTALISDSDAVALVNAGVDFSAGDTVTVEAQGTQLSSTLKGLHDLHVDAIRVETGVSALHLDAGDLTGISADDLPQFDIDQTDAALDVTLRVDAGALGEVERLAAALRAAGIDHFAVDQPIASYDTATQAQMQAIATASGIDFVYEEAPAGTFSTMMFSGGPAELPSDASLYRELLTSFESPDDLGAGGEFVLMDGAVHSLFEAGMLRAYTADQLVVDATGSSDLILTSLRDIADMGVDQVLLPEMHGAPVYVEIGQMLPGSELDEVRHLFDALEDRAASGSLFEGNEKIALVVDSDVAHALSQVEGGLDKLATLGFTELDVLLTNGAPAPFETGTGVEVKLIGQDDDLYRHLHHDR